MHDQYCKVVINSCHASVLLTGLLQNLCFWCWYGVSNETSSINWVTKICTQKILELIDFTSMRIMLISEGCYQKFQSSNPLVIQPIGHPTSWSSNPWVKKKRRDWNNIIINRIKSIEKITFKNSFTSHWTIEAGFSQGMSKIHKYNCKLLMVNKCN